MHQHPCSTGKGSDPRILITIHITDISRPLITYYDIKKSIVTLRLSVISVTRIIASEAYQLAGRQSTLMADHVEAFQMQLEEDDLKQVTTTG